MQLNNFGENKSDEIKSIINIIASQKNINLFVKNQVLHLGDSYDYAENFGYQWSEFQKTQYDSYTGYNLTEDRLKLASGWDLINIKDKLLLEIGSGAGRFTEILKNYGAKIVSLDLSNAIYVNQQHNEDPNILFIKCSLEDIVMLQNTFDYVLCYGVVQHTPNPRKTYEIICSYAKFGALISADHYIKKLHPSPIYHPKYLWRPITSRMEPLVLLKVLRAYLPYYIKFDTLLMRFLPREISTVIRGLIPIPCWNYYGIENIPQDSDTLLEWAVMDTFDALGAKYDYPASIVEVKRWVSSLGLKWFEIKKGGTGIVFNGCR